MPAAQLTRLEMTGLIAAVLAFSLLVGEALASTDHEDSNRSRTRLMC